MGFAERLAKSVVTDTLEHSEAHTMPVELVASMSGASRLGSDLFRAADADAEAFRRAILLLTREVIKGLRIDRSFAFRLSTTAIKETLFWQCHKCNGAGQVIAGNLKVVCNTCGGTGLHRWTDAERAKDVGVRNTAWPKCEKKYDVVLRMAMDAFLSTVGASRKKLGA